MHAYQQSEKYKVGKFVLEKARLIKLLDQQPSTYLQFERLTSAATGENQRQRSQSPWKYQMMDVDGDENAAMGRNAQTN